MVTSFKSVRRYFGTNLVYYSEWYWLSTGRPYGPYLENLVNSKLKLAHIKWTIHKHYVIFASNKSNIFNILNFLEVEALPRSAGFLVKMTLFDDFHEIYINFNSYLYKISSNDAIACYPMWNDVQGITFKVVINVYNLTI